MTRISKPQYRKGAKFIRSLDDEDRTVKVKRVLFVGDNELPDGCYILNGWKREKIKGTGDRKTITPLDLEIVRVIMKECNSDTAVICE